MKYDVFLSYSHADSALAERISQRIRRYRPPRGSVVDKRRLTVFRDVERLTAASDLKSTLEEKVGEAKNFMVLASPDAALSTYVDLESRTFIDARGPEHVIIVLCRGEINTAVPQSIANLDQELLYVDLRKSGRKHFQLESLRLIAALLGVDYSALRREDDERRRFRRNSAVLAVLASIALLLSGYIITVTPPEGWVRIKQPQTRMTTNALAPVEVIAINRVEPHVVAWFGRNARHSRDIDPASAFVWKPDHVPSNFEKKVKGKLSVLAGKPAASLDLKFEYRGTEGLIRIRIFAISQGGTVSFARKGSIRTSQNTWVPFPLTEKTHQPFDLEPDISASLRALQLTQARIYGTLVDHTEQDQKFQVEFYREDMRADMKEVLDAVSSPEHLIFSNGAAWDKRFREEQAVSNGWDAWDVLVTGKKEWLLHKPPTWKSFSLTSGYLSQVDDIDKIIKAASDAGVEKALAEILMPQVEHTGFYSIRVLSSDPASVAVAKPYIDNDEIVKQPEEIWAFKSHDTALWQLLQLPTAEQTKVKDLVSIDSQTAIVVTDREGLFRTNNGGVSWENVNFRHDDFVRAANIKLIVAPGPTVYALAILSTDPGGELNPLFMLQQWSWVKRWRIGVAGLLRKETE